MQETLYLVRSLGPEVPLERGMATLFQCFCLGNPVDRGDGESCVKLTHRIGRCILSVYSAVASRRCSLNGL